VLKILPSVIYKKTLSYYQSIVLINKYALLLIVICPVSAFVEWQIDNMAFDFILEKFLACMQAISTREDDIVLV